MHTIWKDLRGSLRALLQRPAFTAVAIFSLALGIGANTTVFTLVKAVLLKPLPVHQPETLVAVLTTDEKNDASYDSISYPNASDLSEQAKSLSEVVVNTFGTFFVEQGGEPDLTLGQFVSGNYFDALGVDPARGRALRPSDAPAPGTGDPVVVMSHGFWERRYGADPNVIGSAVKLNGQPYTVVGVMPRGFTGNQVQFEPHMWLPLNLLEQVIPGYDPDNDAFSSRRGLMFSSFARLAEGATLVEARAELDLIGQRLSEQFPAANKGRNFRPDPLAEVALNPNPEARERMRLGLALLMGLVTLVLLIACGNVVNLLLARATARSREVAIRLSLGSTRWQLVRRFLLESLLLSFFGGVAGMVVAAFGRELILASWPARLTTPGYDLSLDYRVLGFAFAVTVFAGLVFGLLPALKASRADVVGELKETPTQGGGRHRLTAGNLLVVGQVALALVALIATGLFIRSLDATREVDPRFDAEHLAVLTFDISPLGYDQERGEAFYRTLMERAAQIPGAEAATVAEGGPFSGVGFGRTVFLEGQSESSGEGGRFVLVNAVYPGYFDLLGLPILTGRDFNAGDQPGAPQAVIVNQKMAKMFWKDENPVGQRFRFHGDEEDRYVVAVVGDCKYFQLSEEEQPFAFYPVSQMYDTNMRLFVRGAGDPSLLLPGMREVLKELEPNLPWRGQRTLPEAIDRTLFQARTVSRLLAIFGSLALILSLIGLFGVVSYSVAQRHREIGIRMALGARRRSVVSLVLNQGMVLVGGGLALGLLASWGAGKLVAGFLYQTSPTDLLTFVAVPLLLALVGALAILVPARRAASVDPVVALKYE